MGSQVDQRRAQLTEIENWILTKNAANQPDLTAIDPDLDLIKSGLISSLHFVELMFLIGKLTGRRPAMEKLTADQFRTLNRIDESFLEPA
jgi:hypothetical protein